MWNYKIFFWPVFLLLCRWQNWRIRSFCEGKNGSLQVSHLSTTIKKFAAENTLLEWRENWGKRLIKDWGKNKKCCTYVSYPVTTDDLTSDWYPRKKKQQKNVKKNLYMRRRKICAGQQITWARAYTILNKLYLGHTMISTVSSKEVLKFWAHIQRASF